MTKRNCTSGPRSTKEKRIPFARTLWGWGSCLFYYKKQPSTPSLPTLFIRQGLPVDTNLEGFRYV